MLQLFFILGPIALILFFRIFGSVAEEFVLSKSERDPLDDSGSGRPAAIHSFQSAKVGYILDGDTVDVSIRGGTIRIRLSAIDCPEDDQPWGDSARYGLIKLIGGRKVLLEIYGQDHYGRTLATIFVKKGAEDLNVNEQMVMLGHAWVMRRYYGHLSEARRRRLNQLENWAKTKRVGLWRSENPTPPWEWRNEPQKPSIHLGILTHRKTIQTYSGKKTDMRMSKDSLSRRWDRT